MASDTKPSVAEIVRRLRQLDEVNATSLRALSKEVSQRLAAAAPTEIVTLAMEVVAESPPGAYAFAYLLILRHPAALATMRLADLERFGRGMNGWGEVDAFAGVAGVAWRNGQISDAAVYRWARSRNRWWRRAALVSTVPLNVKAQGGEGDARRTLAICSLLIADRDDMVVKAMSWALRALAVREPDVVAEFVSRNEEQLASRAVREVRNKLQTGRKDGRRKEI